MRAHMLRSVQCCRWLLAAFSHFLSRRGQPRSISARWPQPRILSGLYENRTSTRSCNWGWRAHQNGPHMLDKNRSGSENCPNLRGKRILVLEDDPIIAVEWYFQLKRLGATQVFEATNQSALQHLVGPQRRRGNCRLHPARRLLYASTRTPDRSPHPVHHHLRGHIRTASSVNRRSSAVKASRAS